MGYRGDVIVQMDWCVGEILKALDRLDLTDNTLVIFSSDNGPVLDDGYVDQANERVGDHQPAGPYRAGKYSLFEGGTRVPTLVRWPKQVKPNSVSDALFGQVDMAASIAKLVDAKLPGDGMPDSRDELDTLLGKDPVGRPHLLHEARALALRQGAWKFIPAAKTREKLGPWNTVEITPPGWLFDLESDPGEQTNVAGEHPERVAAMSKLLARLRDQHDRLTAVQTN